MLRGALYDHVYLMAVLGFVLLAGALLALPLCTVLGGVGLGCLVLTVGLAVGAIAALWAPGRGCPGCRTSQTVDLIQGVLIARCMTCGRTWPR